MRSLSEIKTSLLRGSASLVALFSLSSMSPYQDPSLLAAEEYNPTLWNGPISNEDLHQSYFTRRDIISKLEKSMFTHPRTNRDLPRAAHRPLDLMNLLAADVHNSIEANNSTAAEYARAFSYQAGVPYYRALDLIFTLERIHREQQFQDNANCYGYAINDRNNDFYAVNPGSRFHPYDTPFADITNDPARYDEFVRTTIHGAVSDGLVYTGNEFASRRGHYRVALFIRPANQEQHIINEFHWVRQNNDGTWSHKYGNQNVTNIDFAGQPITDVRRADFDNYRFIGYFLVPQGGIDGSPVQLRPGQSPPVIELPPGPEIIVTAPRRAPT